MKNLFSDIPLLSSDSLCLKRLEMENADDLHRLAHQKAVYRYEPTFLFEHKYPDTREVIRRLYDECLEDSLILGIFQDDQFCGLAEMYGYREPIHKISVGYRLSERFWGRGIASETLGAMIRYLYRETDIEIVTASTMVENRASARVLEKNEFTLVVHASPEDWGYEAPTPAEKWIR